MSRSRDRLTTSTDPLFTRPEILLEPQIVKPLHGLNPRTILGTKWWDMVRQRAYAKNKYCCWACGIHKTQIKDVKPYLDAHESYKILPWECSYELQEIVALCRKCHGFIHFGRTTHLYNSGKISEAAYKMIYDYGNNVLSRAGLDASDAWWYDPDIAGQFLPEKIGTWNKWHLIIGEKRYESKFKGFKEWQEYYQNYDTNQKSRVWEDPSTGNRSGGGYSGSRSNR